MTFAVWKDEYSLGNDVIDTQHKFLFQMLNELAEAGPGDKESAAYICLSRMEKYAQDHFRDEENFMRENNYPGLEQHIRAHEGFMVRVSDYQEAVFGGYVPFADMLEFLKNWLVEHILVIDRQYMHHIRSS